MLNGFVHKIHGLGQLVLEKVMLCRKVQEPELNGGILLIFVAGFKRHIFLYLLKSRLKVLAHKLYLLRDVVEFTEVHDKGGDSLNDEGSHVSI